LNSNVDFCYGNFKNQFLIKINGWVDLRMWRDFKSNISANLSKASI
jgi:hypothetical protein